MQTKMPPAPQYPREWKLSYRWPDSVKPGTPTVNTDLDQHFKALAWPDGWAVVGVMPCSRPGATCAPDWSGWYVRVTLWPNEWIASSTFRAPIAVYAAAQMAGLATNMDQWLAADWHGVQFRLPDGSPVMRQAFWDHREVLPDHINLALDVMEYAASRSGHYMWGRPDTGRARAAAEQEEAWDRERADKARVQVVDWIRAKWGHVLA